MTNKIWENVQQKCFWQLRFGSHDIWTEDETEYFLINQREEKHSNVKKEKDFL